MCVDSPGVIDRRCWDPALETGDRTIDLVHMQLFAFVNDITVAVLADAPRLEIYEAVVDLLRLIGAHATAEKNLMVAFGCKGLEKQRATQEELARNLSAAIAAYLTDQNSSVEPVLEYARIWLQDHVTLDRHLAQHMRAPREEALR